MLGFCDGQKKARGGEGGGRRGDREKKGEKQSGSDLKLYGHVFVLVDIDVPLLNDVCLEGKRPSDAVKFLYEASKED